MLNAGVLAILSGLAAQAVKVLLELVLRRRWRPALFLRNGGMPSSHTATVTTLVVLTGRQAGVDAPVFGLVLVFAVYVVFEATGLRQEIGHQARLLNEILDAVRDHQTVDRERMREFVGHTWGEVAGGALFGALFALLFVSR
jgi:acid phosphatase family membrane protein YuiD